MRSLGAGARQVNSDDEEGKSVHFATYWTKYVTL